VNINNIGAWQLIARQQLDKHTATRASHNRTIVYSSLLSNSGRANGLARWLSRDLFFVWSALRNNRIVFSVRGSAERL
jgi:hypothetical protein